MTETNQRKPWLGYLLKFGVPLVVSVGLCYLLFTGIDFKEMIGIIRRECNFWWIAVAMGLTVCSHIARAFRWRIQLRALEVYPPVYALIYSIFGTYAVNLVFPRLGEVWRTGYIAQRQDAPFPTVFGSMIADRLSDTVTVFLLLAFTFVLASNAILDYLGQNGEGFQAIVSFCRSPWLWLSVVVLIALVVAFMLVKTNVGWILSARKAIKGLWDGFIVIFHMPKTGLWLLLTVVIWGCYFMQMWACFYAFPFTEQLIHEHGLIVVLVSFVLGSISMAVPSNGGIGPWQWAVIFALNIYGLDSVHGSAFANLVKGCDTLLLIILGIITFIGIALDRKRTVRAADVSKQQ